MALSARRPRRQTRDEEELLVTPMYTPSDTPRRITQKRITRKPAPEPEPEESDPEPERTINRQPPRTKAVQPNTRRKRVPGTERKAKYPPQFIKEKKYVGSEDDTEAEPSKSPLLRKKPTTTRKVSARIPIPARKPNPWMEHLQEFREAHPEIPYRECMKLARETYK